MLAPAPLSLPLELVAPFCSTRELARLSLLDTESARACEPEWRTRVLARFGSLRFRPSAWRRCYALRTHLARRVVDATAARVYIMNGRGETRLLALRSSRALPCSRERAAVYSRCERMFELSLRINRSVQEISALVGAVSPDEARALLREHLALLASVASLRGSLLFESELFPVFPAPVLLDANALLRGTLVLSDAESEEEGEEEEEDASERREPPKLRFTDTSTLMMQVWASIDGLIYRPLAPPAVLDLALHAPVIATEAVGEAATTGELSAERSYNVVRLHDLSGMTINLDDNTLRYRLEAHALCVNALVSNAYLLYVFNPLGFRPLDWTFHAVVRVDSVQYELPVQREGVFLNTASYTLRVFLSYGKIPDSDTATAATSNSRSRGGENSAPLAIPCADGDHVVAFRLTATNRISKRECEVVAKSSVLTTSDYHTGDSSPTSEMEQRAAEKLTTGDPSVPSVAPLLQAASTERHVHLAYDAMICYSFSASHSSLQYIEFAIGFEPLMHQLGVSPFLHESVAPA